MSENKPKPTTSNQKWDPPKPKPAPTNQTTNATDNSNRKQAQ